MKEERPCCPKCGKNESIKSGQHLGRQRYKCKSCSCQYTRSDKRGRPAQEKWLALWLYMHGLSLNAIGKLLKVSTPAVLKWVKALGEQVKDKPLPSSVAVVELDEMWHYLHHKKTNTGYGKLIVAIPVSSLTGNVALVINPPLSDSGNASSVGTSVLAAPTIGKPIAPC